MATLNSGPETLDWTWYVGDTEPETFIITGESPVDLTGATIAAQARATAKDPVVAATAVITATNLANGEFTIGWDGEELRPLVEAAPTDKWVGVWDLQITLADGSIRTRVAGRFTAEHDVTRGG